MRKVLASLLVILGVSSGAPALTAPQPSKGSAELRAMVFRLQGLKPGMFPHGVWGIVMETGLDNGYYTLVVLGDGTTSLYFSNGGGIIGAGTHPQVRSASHTYLERANEFAAAGHLASGTEPPAEGTTKFYFLTFEGTREYSAKEQSLGESQDKLSALFYAAQDVITAVRKDTP